MMTIRSLLLVLALLSACNPSDASDDTSATRVANGPNTPDCGCINDGGGRNLVFNNAVASFSLRDIFAGAPPGCKSSGASVLTFTRSTQVLTEEFCVDVDSGDVPTRTTNSMELTSLERSQLESVMSRITYASGPQGLYDGQDTVLETVDRDGRVRRYQQYGIANLGTANGVSDRGVMKGVADLRELQAFLSRLASQQRLTEGGSK